ncbi:hypothetical protein C8Q76DRAFT_763657 [Earliella scabrosa]|nr:hypothetical protein C8Q76DRAFT_763657 [Earliella scabrosa]
MFWLSVVSLASAALCYASFVPSVDQTPLGGYQGDSHRVLRRYALQGRNIQEVVRAAELAHGRIWTASSSHVDVLFDDAEQKLGIPLPEAGTLPLSRPEHLASSYGNWNLTSLSNTTYHAFYHPLSEIENFMDDLATAHPSLVQLVPLGHSGEGREMVGLRISKDAPPPSLSLSLQSGRPSSTKKLGFVITGAQHAREWIATSTALYLAHSLVADRAEQFSLSSWLDYFDFYIIPVPNPDGYVHTWKEDRFWYKNRQNIGPDEKCIGIDMNRNWGHKWKSKSRLPAFDATEDEDEDEDENGVFEAGRGANADPCSTWYPGHRPFEAPEVNNIANFITTLPSLKAFVDLRSYGQMLSTPFSWSCKKTPKDAEDQLEAALGAAHAIKEVHGTVFTAGSLCEQLYKASGNVVDYMYAKAGIKFSYSVHLRDTGTVSGHLIGPLRCALRDSRKARSLARAVRLLPACRVDPARGRGDSEHGRLPREIHLEEKV